MPEHPPTPKPWRSEESPLGAAALAAPLVLTCGCGVFGSEVPIAAASYDDTLATGQVPLERGRDDLGQAEHDSSDAAQSRSDTGARVETPGETPTCAPDGRPCTPLFVDEDGDGYGAPGSPRCLCEPDYPSGHVTPHDGDCDDLEGSVHPHAAERCDAVDNDCDGETDEEFLVGAECGTGVCAGGKTVCSEDGSTLACSTGPGGEQDRSGDEICNRKDDDCDGSTDEEGACRP